MLTHSAVLESNIPPTNSELDRLRLASSPLLELVMSYRVLLNPAFRTLYYSWCEQALNSIHDTDYPIMNALIEPAGYIPDFITPTPTLVQLDLEVELNRMLDTPPAAVQRDLVVLIRAKGEHPLRQQMLLYPSEYLPCLVEEMRDYWQRAVAPHWSRMMAVLENDILYRSRLLMVKGIEPMVNDLNSIISYDDNRIVVSHKDKNPYSLSFKEESLQLVPVIFAANHVYHQITPEWKRMIIYTARGSGLWQYEMPEPNSALELTLGIGKARLLLALQTPMNTGELAHKLMLTAGAISQQLKNLQQAGLTESFRNGKNVYHRLTLRGEKLLELF